MSKKDSFIGKDDVKDFLDSVDEEKESAIFQNQNNNKTGEIITERDTKTGEEALVIHESGYR